MLKESQKLTNSAAFSQPSGDNTASNLAASFISSSYTTVLLATAPTVSPLSLIKPVTMSLAQFLLTSKKALSSASSARARDVSPTAFAIVSLTLLRSSVHSSSATSSLLAGRRDTNCLIWSRTEASSPVTSTIPASSLWNLAEAVSSLDVKLPSSALGLLTKSFADFSSINVKSVRVGTTAIPPPHVPKIAVICGITPDASTCLA